MINVWNADRCEDLCYAISLLDKQNVQLVSASSGERLDGDMLDGHEIWRSERDKTALHAVKLRKSLLDHALQHDHILEMFKNEAALQNVCGDVIQHLANEGPSTPLGKELMPILCFLLLTWFSRYMYQKSKGKRSEDIEEQETIKQRVAHCEATSCPCVLFHPLGLRNTHAIPS